MTLKILNIEFPSFPISYSRKDKKISIDYQSAERIYKIIAPFLRFHDQADTFHNYFCMGRNIYSSTKNVAKSVKAKRARRAIEQKTKEIKPEDANKKADVETKKEDDVSAPTHSEQPAQQITTIDNVPIALLKLTKTVSIISLQVFNARAGMITVTAIGIAEDLKDMAVAANNKEVRKSLEALSRVIGSGLFLTAQIYGGPELILASLIVRLLLTLYKSLKEFQHSDDHTLEALGNLILATIFAYQLQPHIELVQRKWEVIRDPRFQNIKLHLNIASGIKTPMENLKQTIAAKMVIIKDKVLGTINLGAHFSNIGGGLVKGSNVSARTKVIDGKEVTEVEFKLTHFQREQLKSLVTELQNLPKDKLSDFLMFSGVNNSGINIQVVPYTYMPIVNGQYTQAGAQSIGNAYQISLAGVGTVIIGQDSSVQSLYDRVVVRLDTQQNATNLKNMLAVVGLEKAVKPSTSEEIERLKIAMLMDTYHPKEATELTHGSTFFTTPLPQLKQWIVSAHPDMKTRLEMDLKKMQPVEVLPGRIRYSIPDLAKQARNMGAVALMSGITSWNNSEAYQRAATILTTGALSSQVRFDAGLNVQGVSSGEDHRKGSADEVFTRIITDNILNKNMMLDQIAFFNGPVQLIYSLKVLETGTYQYGSDMYGSKSWYDYILRPSLFNFIKQNRASFGSTNEVMIKEAIPPKYVVGCVVRSEQAKTELVKVLEQNNLVKNIKGSRYVNGTLLHDFIKVGDRLTSNMVQNATKDI
jgi:hypothetical protein